MLRTIVVFAPIIAALAWVIFNIQKPARPAPITITSFFIKLD